MVGDPSEDGDQWPRLRPRSGAKANEAEGLEKPGGLDLIIICSGRFGCARIDLDKVGDVRRSQKRCFRRMCASCNTGIHGGFNVYIVRSGLDQVDGILQARFPGQSSHVFSHLDKSPI